MRGSMSPDLLTNSTYKPLTTAKLAFKKYFLRMCVPQFVFFVMLWIACLCLFPFFLLIIFSLLIWFFNVKMQHTLRKGVAASILLSQKAELKMMILSGLRLRKWCAPNETLSHTENAERGALGSLGSSFRVKVSLPSSACLSLAPPSPWGKPFKVDFFFFRQEQVIKCGIIFPPKPAIKSRIITLTFPCLPT